MDTCGTNCDFRSAAQFERGRYRLQLRPCLRARLLLNGLTFVLTVPTMRAVVQRVRFAKVSVNSELIAQIEKGLCVLVGVGLEDSSVDVDYIAAKLAGLRVFEDADGKMNLSTREVDGEILLVSQFTLFGDIRRGNRPSFTQASPPSVANELFENLVRRVREVSQCNVRTGRFRAHMDVELANDGPVTILIDSKRVF